MAMASALNGKQKRYLRALAHHKKPVVQLGKDGLTDAVRSQIDQSLEIHELIKVKVSSADEDLEVIGQQIAQKTRASLCDVIGRTLLFYRRRSKEPTIVLPRARAAKGSAGGKPSSTEGKAR
jgi:RNA-binding protein